MSNREEVEMYGKKWRRYPDNPGGVYFSAQLKLHELVWIVNHGSLPGTGYHIHHIDGDPANNDISNLEAMSIEDHLRHHALEGGLGTFERRNGDLEKAREAAKEWHASETGRQWHSEMAQRAWVTREAVQQVCAHCGETYETFFPNRSKYCSNACKAAARRRRKADHERRECAHCGAEFYVNRYEPTRFGSRTCAQRYRSQRAADGVQSESSR